jgi:hypothetical protein
MQELVVA